MVGSEDPLFDDSLKTMERMISSGIDCSCLAYEDMPHGFMNMDFVLPECQQTVLDSINLLN